MGIHQFAIGRPELFDRKVRAEQTAFGAEQRNRIVEDLGDVRWIVSMNECAKSRKLGDDVRTRRELLHADAPGRAALRRSVFQHAGVLQNERHTRTSLGKPSRIRHLGCEDLQIKTPIIVGKPRDVATEFRICAEVRPRGESIKRVFVPMQLHADTLHERIFGEPVELRTNVLDVEIGKGHDGMRPSVLVRRALHPGGFVFEAVVGPIGLHIDRSGHAGACKIGAIFLNRIIAPDRVIGSKDARLHRTDQPGQVRPTPDMMMCVDELTHAALLVPSDNKCATTAALEPPSTRSSTKR